MAAKTVSQKKFAKLVASTGSLSQPPGALPRMSNLLFTQRGSLQIADGSFAPPIPSIYPLAYARALLSFTKANSVTGIGQYPPILARIMQLAAPSLAGVVNVAASFNTGGGNPNVASHYQFAVVALDASGGTTSISYNPSPVVSVTAAWVDAQATVAFNTVTVTWQNISTAVSYQIWYLGKNSFGPPNPPYAGIQGILLGTAGAGVTTFTSTPGLFPDPNTDAPWLNSTQYIFLNDVIYQDTAGGPFYSTLPPGGAPSAAAKHNIFPAVTPQPVSLQIGDPQFNPSFVLPGYSPYGGISGQACPIPTVVQFAGQAIVILGNGLPPVAYDPSTDSEISPPSPRLLINTFQDSYPTWEASVSWTTDDQLTAASGTTNYYFTATQGGVSGATTPSWQFTKGAKTTDGTVIWTSQGPIVSSVAPIGAAHAVAYAGSLWLANTWPVTTGFSSWAGSTFYDVGTQIEAQDSATPANSWLFTVQIAGTSNSTEPTWTFYAGGTITDGTVTWVCTEKLSDALAAGIDGPSCLKMSDANDPNSWNPTNVAFIGKNDGSQITGLCPFTIAALGISPTGSLCIFKEFTTYQFIGVFGTTSFEVQPAQTSLGCIASRSIQFLAGFGVVRYTHLGFAVFDGINDRLISEDIRPYLFGGVDSESDLTPVDPAYCYLSQSAQTVAPPMYMCATPLLGAAGVLTRLFCYDLVVKSWAVLDLPWAITSMATVAGGEGYPLVLVGKTDGTIQRLQAGDLNWDQGDTAQSAVQWSFRTPDLFGEGGTQRLFYEKATITGYGSPAMVQSIIASLWLDGQQIGAQGIDVVPMGGSNLFTASVSIFRNGNRAHLDISGNNGGAAGVIDSVDWAVTAKSSMARRIIS